MHTRVCSRLGRGLKAASKMRLGAAASVFAGIGLASVHHTVTALSQPIAAPVAAAMGGGAADTAEQKDRRELYPKIEPYKTGFLKVSDLHTIYFEESGNPQGKPVLVVHGGPGGGSQGIYRQYFDPAAYRIIQFDQRGAGQSTPFACLEDNTTQALVADMEKLREHTGVEKWMLFGGSWGSTLSLAYATTHPSKVKALVLRGIFMLRRSELEWFYQGGAHHLFPDAWDAYLAPIPEVERADLMSAYHRRLTGDDEKVKQECASAWSIWEMSTSRLYVDPQYIAKAAENDKFALAFARIESHFFVNGGFFKEDGELLVKAPVLSKYEIPGTIVHGRYDVVCPIRSAWDLKKVWPEADLKIVNDAGHSCIEPGIIDELVQATDKYRGL